MNKIQNITIDSGNLQALDDYEGDSNDYINIHSNKRELVSPNIEFFYNNLKSNESDFDYTSDFVLKPILKKAPFLNYFVQSSSGKHNYKDAVIFGTQINMINAIKQRQENLASDADIVADLALPLPCNSYETITIKINTAIKNQYIQKKCFEDNGGYYYSEEDHQSTANDDVEEFAIINAELLDGVDEYDSNKLIFKKQKITKKVRFV
uniref:Uncharacterized protein n=1 Tax=Hanseniaspora uvarum TaxID=29833 RepID=A0A1E5RD54_HANUV